MHWLYPANLKFYDVVGAFAEPATYWPVSSSVEPDDVVYIYLAAPHKQIAFVCDVLKTGLDENAAIEHVRPFFKGDPSSGRKKQFMKLHKSADVALTDASPLSYARLKENGLTGMLMGPRKLENNPALLTYIEGNAP
ncbi:MAG: hypothetical protein ACPGRZ_00790 [Alphaproteobacteria bacterium]